MDMMNSIVAMSMSMQAAQLQQNYAMGVQKLAMNQEKMAMQEIQEMLPSEVAPKGQYIDVYA